MRAIEMAESGQRWTAGLLAAFTLLCFAGVLRADSIRLLDEAGVSGDRVTLGQIAELSGPSAEALADTVVAETPAGRPVGQVSLRDVRVLLGAQGADWSRLSLSGFRTCQLVRVGRIDEPEAQPAAAPAVSNVEQPIGVDMPLTVGDHVRERLVELTGADPSDLKIVFSDRDTAILAESAIGQELQIEPLAKSAIGRVPMKVRWVEAGQVVRQANIGAEVTRRVLAVVVKDHISRGRDFTRDNVEVREVWLDKDLGEPVQQLRLLLGQEANAILREGTVVYPRHVQSPLVVRRGQLMTVECHSGRLVIRTVMKAQADGAIDQVIEARNEASKETVQVTVTGRRQGEMQL